MSSYYLTHLEKLKAEVQQRCGCLLEAMKPSNTRMYGGCNVGHVDPSAVRLAVDDFKSILAEIRRLK